MKSLRPLAITIILLAAAPGFISAQTETAVADSVTGIVNRQIKENNFSGIVRVLMNDKTIYSSIYGYSDEASKVPITSATRFSIGSIGKLMTAVLVMKLVEEGKVDVQKPISEYLPEWKIPNGDIISVKDILEMRAGIGNYMASPDHRAFAGKQASLDELMKIVVSQQLLHESPGSNFSYSNSSYIILGKLVEKVERKDYFEVLTERIFKPSKISGATFKYNLEDAKGFAKGYVSREGNWVAQTALIPPASDGGLFISIDDFQKFDEALFNGKIISKKTLESMWAADFDTYGFGMMKGKVSTGIVVGHNGGMPGYEAEYRRFIVGGNQYTVLILTNHDRKASMFMREIRTNFDKTLH